MLKFQQLLTFNIYEQDKNCAQLSWGLVQLRKTGHDMTEYFDWDVNF